ncbi:MAG: DoxX family protein [Acidobacteria bacterium]|jgi:putative oxidoreductase|nr:DoxX family protein [Acidobacteriota bacterium]
MTSTARATRLLTGVSPALLDLCLLLLRCTVGVILFVIGAGKVLGWFGGHGMAATVQGFAQMGIAAPLVYLSALTEFIGGLLLLIGLLTRPAAVAVTINMLVATIVMWPKGFFYGGAGYPFALLMCSIVILLAGPMAWSLDGILFPSPENRQEGPAAS